MTFSKHQPKLEHRSDPAYQGAHKPAPGAEGALAWLLLETVSSSGSFWPNPADRAACTPLSDANLSQLAVKARGRVSAMVSQMMLMSALWTLPGSSIRYPPSPVSSLVL